MKMWVYACRNALFVTTWQVNQMSPFCLSASGCLFRFLSRLPSHFCLPCDVSLCHVRSFNQKEDTGDAIIFIIISSCKNIKNSSEILIFFKKFSRNWIMFYQSKVYQNLNICRIVLRVLQHICERISSDVWDFEINVNLKFDITHQKFHLKLLSCLVNQYLKCN